MGNAGFEGNRNVFGDADSSTRAKIRGIRMVARTVTPAMVRSLEAIHLGTAMRFRSSLTSFVTYDKRLLDAAQAAGLPINSPT